MAAIGRPQLPGAVSTVANGVNSTSLDANEIYLIFCFSGGRCDYFGDWQDCYCCKDTTGTNLDISGIMSLHMPALPEISLRRKDFTSKLNWLFIELVIKKNNGNRDGKEQGHDLIRNGSFFFKLFTAHINQIARGSRRANAQHNLAVAAPSPSLTATPPSPTSPPPQP
ncbi:hypothetical protein EJB05_33623, partial [Eragrostis curvula]